MLSGRKLANPMPWGLRELPSGGSTRAVSFLWPHVHEASLCHSVRGMSRLRRQSLHLAERGRTERYVREQDTADKGEAPAAGEGPIDEIRTTVDYLACEVEPRLATVSA